MLVYISCSFLISLYLETYKYSLLKLTHTQLHKLKKENSSKKNIFALWLKHRKIYQMLVFILAFINDGVFLIYSFNYYSLKLFIGLLLVYLIVKDVPRFTGFVNHYFMSILYGNNFLFYPFTFLFIPYYFITNRISSKFTDMYQEEETLKASKEDQILSLVEQDNQSEQNTESLEENEKRMIQGVFNLDDGVVREVMTPRIDIKSISLECSFEKTIEAFTEYRFSRLPIYNKTVDEIIGVIHVKDFLNPAEDKRSIEELMYKTLYVPETKKLDELLNDFRKAKSHFAVVVDEYGGTSGIITIEDILEEIVGEIQDEFDEEEEQQLFFDENGLIQLDARTPVADINRSLEVSITEDDSYETLGGYIFSILGEIPCNGVILKQKGLEFNILNADERKINLIKISKYEEQ